MGTLQSLTGQRNPVFKRSFWKNHHKGIDLLGQKKKKKKIILWLRKPCVGRTWCHELSRCLTSVVQASIIKPSTHVRAPHLTSSSQLVIEKGSEEYLSSAGIQPLQFTPLLLQLHCLMKSINTALHIRQEGPRALLYSNHPPCPIQKIQRDCQGI